MQRERAQRGRCSRSISPPPGLTSRTTRAVQTVACLWYLPRRVISICLQEGLKKRPEAATPVRHGLSLSRQYGLIMCVDIYMCVSLFLYFVWFPHAERAQRSARFPLPRREFLGTYRGVLYRLMATFLGSMTRWINSIR